MIKKLLPVLFLLLILVPVFASAASIVPCGGIEYDDNGKVVGPQPPCDFNMLLELVNRVINWIVVISAPIAAGVFAWAGILYMTTAIAGKKEEAKKMLGKVFWGFVFILSAWIIVTTITKALLSTEFINAVPVQGVK